MSPTCQKLVGCGALLAALVLGGCEPKRIPPMTVSDLMEDRVTLDGVLMKCNQNLVKARDDSGCRNARIAIDRLAQDVDPAELAKRTAEFERSREQLRLSQERVRQDQESRARIDPYNLPMVPVDPVPSAGTGPSAGAAPSSGAAPAAVQPKP